MHYYHGTQSTSGNNRRFVSIESGFTLIEVLIVVAIIGVIAAFAVPSYSTYVIKANRTDAMSTLSEVAGEQQRYFSENNVYATSLSQLGYGSGDTFVSPEKYYTISVTTPDTGAITSYLLSATPVVTGKQRHDAQCEVFTLSSTGAKANTGGTSSDCW